MLELQEELVNFLRGIFLGGNVVQQSPRQSKLVRLFALYELTLPCPTDAIASLGEIAAVPVDRANYTYDESNSIV